MYSEYFLNELIWKKQKEYPQENSNNPVLFQETYVLILLIAFIIHIFFNLALFKFICYYILGN